MKHWNYRVIEFPAVQDEPARRELREVYYDDAGRPCAYGAPAQVLWDDEEDPATPYSILQRMREALDKPVLDARDFEHTERPSPLTEATSFTVILEKDPDSDDLLLPLPAKFLADQDWRAGDRINFEVLADGRYALTNVSKAERES
jgi:hypothetical protein